MGLLDRVNAETRAIGGVPWRPWDDPYWRFDAGGPIHPSRAGTTGQDGALRLAPVYACVRVLADGVAKLPLQQYRDTGTRKVKMPSGQLLSEPSAYGGLYDWLFIAMTSLALHGNAYGLITQRDGYGYPVSVEWLPPDAVTVEDVQPWNPAKARFWYFGRPVAREDLLHIRAFALPGRTEAVSPLRAFQALIESGHAALEYGDGWYRSGGFPPGTFQNTAYEVTNEQSAEIKKLLVNAIRRHEPLVHGRDWTFTPISVPPNEAQFIEAQQLTATQIASVYGVMARKAGGIHGDSQTYSNVAMDQLNEITETLDPWLVRFESALNRCLPVAQSVSFNRDARIRYDLTSRYAAYASARNTGFLNVNEVRELEDREPLPKPRTQDDYDGADWTPLSIQVAAARGAKEILGTGEDGSGPQTFGPAAKPGAAPGVLGALQPHPPVPSAPVNGNGKNGSGKPGVSAGH
jgi:HK97 family phage portal protein